MRTPQEDPRLRFNFLLGKGTLDPFQLQRGMIEASFYGAYRYGALSLGSLLSLERNLYIPPAGGESSSAAHDRELAFQAIHTVMQQVKDGKVLPDTTVSWTLDSKRRQEKAKGSKGSAEQESEEDSSSSSSSSSSDSESSDDSDDPDSGSDGAPSGDVAQKSIHGDEGVEHIGKNQAPDPNASTGELNSTSQQQPGNNVTETTESFLGAGEPQPAPFQTIGNQMIFDPARVPSDNQDNRDLHTPPPNVVSGEALGLEGHGGRVEEGFNVLNMPLGQSQEITISNHQDLPHGQNMGLAEGDVVKLHLVPVVPINAAASNDTDAIPDGPYQATVVSSSEGAFLQSNPSADNSGSSGENRVTSTSIPFHSDSLSIPPYVVYRPSDVHAGEFH